MEDVEVELSVKVPCGGSGGCSQKRMTKTILMWSGMIPAIGDQVNTTFESKTLRLHVVGRLWENRNLTLLCKPVRSFSTQDLINLGFS